MGNSSTKESRPSSSLGHHRPSSVRNGSSPTGAGPEGSGPQTSTERLASSMYTSQSGRRSRPDLSFLGLGGSDRDTTLVETRRETKAEREARKLEKERAAREKERERSMREEGVDGGYLVTLGTYVGPEDFSKQVVRQLMIERRLAPFWRGLEDHSDSWVEHQLVAAAKGLPIPPADQIPPSSPETPAAKPAESPRSSNLNINHLTVPMTSRSMSAQSDRSSNLSPSHPAFSLPPPTSPIAGSPSSPFFRSRAKTLASLTTSARNSSQTEMARQEIMLPKDPYVNGQRVEVFLYKDASECPVCFLYYPPHLNKTRCCDQPICSECFVQIKRPDPHPPEHHDENGNPVPAQEQGEDSLLVSEPSKCPYCTQSEFGVTYEAPPFRRGLVYAGQPGGNSLSKTTSAMSSTTSLNSQGVLSPGGTRRRTTSLSVNADGVISTDKIRPDWAKKLADARAHAMRRAAAATALHNAAYVLGNQTLTESRGILGRRRRTVFTSDSPTSSGRGTPRHGEPSGVLVAAPDRTGTSNQGERGEREDASEGQSDLHPGRHSSRRTRVEDLEELMMMEAIRLSLVAEEERKRKEEKEAAKEAKKEEKRKAKEQKKADKVAKKSGMFLSTDSDGNRSRSSVNVLAGSTINVLAGKGKGVDRAAEPAGESSKASSQGLQTSKENSQRHLEQSREHLQSQVPDSPFGPSVFSALGESSHRAALAKISTNNSSVSSVDESLPGSYKNEAVFGASASSIEASPNASKVSIPGSVSGAAETPNQSETPPGEPMLNFTSLTAAIIEQTKDKDAGERTEHIEDVTEQSSLKPADAEAALQQTRSRGDAIASSSSSQPPQYSQEADDAELEASISTVKPGDERDADADADVNAIESVVETVSRSETGRYDQKHMGNVRIVDGQAHQETQ